MPARPLTPQTAKRRTDRSEATRLKLINVAARIIGKRGYAGCKIARVTSAAKIAHGAFYLHFESQQALFDQVVIVLGQQMVESVVGQIQTPADIRDAESQYVKASLAYLTKHTYMFEVVQRRRSETGMRTPDFQEISFERYVSILRDLADPRLTDAQLRVLTRMIMNARSTVFQLFKNEGGKETSTISEILDVYLEFMSKGVDAAIARMIESGDLVGGDSQANLATL